MRPYQLVQINEPLISSNLNHGTADGGQTKSPSQTNAGTVERNGVAYLAMTEVLQVLLMGRINRRMKQCSREKHGCHGLFDRSKPW
jgi:hypothetical protein